MCLLGGLSNGRNVGHSLSLRKALDATGKLRLIKLATSANLAGIVSVVD